MNAVTLSPHEAVLLLALPESGAPLSLEALVEATELSTPQARSAIERLKLKELVTQAGEDRVSESLRLSPEGEAARAAGLPELRLWKALEAGPIPIKDLQQRPDMDAKEAGAAFGAMKKAGVLDLSGGQARQKEGADLSLWQRRQDLLAWLAEQGEVEVSALSSEQREEIKDSRIKNYFKTTQLKSRDYALLPAGRDQLEAARLARSAVINLTPEMLRDGSWQSAVFQPLSIMPPAPYFPGKRNPYRSFLDKVKRTLVGLGFAEMRGSLVENEFWDMDALFMPQFHPARDIHDVYFVSEPSHGHAIPEPHLSRVAAAHEGQESSGSRGWGYIFDRERTRRLVLRSQGTALSARQLGQKPDVPGRYFSIARCFRYDEVDATHAPDFFQIEGIVLGHETSLRQLLGLLSIFARELAQAEEVRFVPAYFPFTEPSVEVHMRHPSRGWIELGGSGIFRPEVSRSLGVEVPVIAWGLGLDRMYMTAAKVDDIRNLFTNNLARGLGDLRGA